MVPDRAAAGRMPEPLHSAFLAGASLLQARRASLMLRMGDDPLLTVAAAIGWEEEIIPAIHVPLGEGIAGLVAAQGITFFGIQDGTTFLSLPIVTDRRVEGVLNLSDRLGEQPFSEAHIAPARLLAAHLAQLLIYARQVEGYDCAPDFDDMLVRELARSKRAGQPFAVALVDVVDLTGEGTNQTAGFLAGVDQALHRCLRAYDIVSRRRERGWGVILAPPSDAHLAITDRLVSAVQHAIEGEKAEVTLRVGIAHCPRDGMQPGLLLATAEARLEEYGAPRMVTAP